MLLERGPVQRIFGVFRWLRDEDCLSACKLVGHSQSSSSSTDLAIAGEFDVCINIGFARFASLCHQEYDAVLDLNFLLVTTPQNQNGSCLPGLRPR